MRMHNQPRHKGAPAMAFLWGVLLFGAIVGATRVLEATGGEAGNEPSFDTFPQNNMIQGSGVELDWFKTFGGSGDAWFSSIWQNGSVVYVLGNNGTGSGNLQVMKVSVTTGAVIWSRTWGLPSVSEYSGGIWGDATSLYTCGITFPVQKDILLVKWDDAGNELWNLTLGGTDEDEGYGMRGDGAGNIYLCGSTRSFGAGGTDMVLVKLDDDGNLTWFRTWGGSGSDIARDIWVDGTGIYTVGETTSFGAGSYDLAIVKWDASGNPVWNKTWGGNSVEFGWSVWGDGTSLYTCGSTQSYGTAGSRDGVVVRWNVMDGTQEWNRTCGGSSLDQFMGITGNGEMVYACGGAIINTSYPVPEAFIAAYDAVSGVQAWNASTGYSYGYGQFRDIVAESSKLTVCGQITWSEVLGWNGSIARFSITSDYVLPTITLNSPANGTVNAPGTVVDLDVSDAGGSGLSEVLCSWDGAANQTIASPFDIAMPAVGGMHELQVHATDGEGNNASATFSFTVDAVTPVISLNSPANGTVNAPGTVVDLDVSDAGGSGLSEVLCSWDGAANQTIASPFDIAMPAAGGMHELQVHAIDGAGNKARARFVFTVDAMPPTIELPFEDDPIYPQNNSAINSIFPFVYMQINDTGGSGIDWMLYNWDGGANATMGSPYYDIFRNLTLYNVSAPALGGWHVLRVFASDVAGNRASVTFSFIVDYVDPVIVLVSPANNTAHRPGTIIHLDVSDAGGSGLAPGIIVLWDNATIFDGYIVVNSPYEFPVPATAGVHGLRVLAIDGAMNLHAVSCLFIVDDTPPSIALDLGSPANGSTCTSGAVINLAIGDEGGGGIGQVVFNWDGTANQTLASPFDITMPATAGLHVLRVQASDGVGNNASAIFTFTVQPASPPADDPATGDMTMYLVIGGVVGVVAVAGGLVSARRRKGKASRRPDPGSTITSAPTLPWTSGASPGRPGASIGMPGDPGVARPATIDGAKAATTRPNGICPSCTSRHPVSRLAMQEGASCPSCSQPLSWLIYCPACGGEMMLDQQQHASCAGKAVSCSGCGHHFIL